jgi:hypothetical protein
LHANPTKLEPTLLACHVVAALVLFNSRIALWARLGVGQDPIGSFRLVSAFFIPQLEILARRRQVRLFTARQTKLSLASIAHAATSFLFLGSPIHGHRHLVASLAGAPSRQVIAFDKAAQLKALKLGQRFWGGLFHLFFRNEFLALGLGTLLANTRGSLRDRVLDKVLPAFDAKFVGARHAHHGKSLVIANGAQVGRFCRRGMAAGVDAALFEQPCRIVVKDFQQQFLGPIVFSQEDGSGTCGNAQDFCNVL